MAEPHVITALRDKRAHLAGEIQARQKELDALFHQLETLDAVIRMFSPQTNPELIPAIRPAGRRSLYFKHGERTRLCLSALREAAKPVSATWITEHVMAAKGLGEDRLVATLILRGVRSALFNLEGRGLVRKVLRWPESWWELGEG